MYYVAVTATVTSVTRVRGRSRAACLHAHDARGCGPRRRQHDGAGKPRGWQRVARQGAGGAISHTTFRSGKWNARRGVSQTVPAHAQLPASAHFVCPPPLSQASRPQTPTAGGQARGGIVVLRRAHGSNSPSHRQPKCSRTRDPAHAACSRQCGVKVPGCASRGGRQAPRSRASKPPCRPSAEGKIGHLWTLSRLAVLSARLRSVTSAYVVGPRVLKRALTCDEYIVLAPGSIPCRVPQMSSGRSPPSMEHLTPCCAIGAPQERHQRVRGRPESVKTSAHLR